MIYSLAFSGTQLLSTSGYDGGEVVTPGEAMFWDTVTGQARQLYDKFDDAVRAAAIAGDGKRIALAARSGLHLLDTETGAERLLARTALDKPHVAFSPDARLLSWTESGNSTALLDAGTGRQVVALAARGPVVFSRDGRTLATVSTDGKSAQFWEYPSGRLLATLSGHTGTINSLAYSPDEAIFATGSADGSVKLWNGVSAKEMATLAGHAGAVQAVAFAADGTLLAAGIGSGRRSPGEFRLWDLTTRSVIKVVPEPAGEVTAVAFSPDGKLLATAGRSSEGRARPGEIRLWLVSALR